MKKVNVTYYVAEDGKRFDTEDKCLAYEASEATLDSALRKVHFYRNTNEEILFPIDDLKSFYHNEENYDLDFDGVWIIKISKHTANDEWQILDNFFARLAEVEWETVPKHLYAGAVFIWDENDNYWADTRNILAELEQEYTRIQKITFE